MQYFLFIFSFKLTKIILEGWYPYDCLLTFPLSWSFEISEHIFFYIILFCIFLEIVEDFLNICLYEVYMYIHKHTYMETYTCRYTNDLSMLKPDKY